MKYLIGFFLGMTFVFWIQGPPDEPEQEEPQEQEETIDKPDPNREVEGYDRNTKSYIYKEQEDTTPKIVPLTRRLEYMPDYSVSIDDQEEPERTPRYIKKGGKMYKTFKRGDGTIELQEWK